MAIKIKSASGAGITGGVGVLSPTWQEVIIVADTEAEITALPALGQPVTDADGVSVIPNVGSTTTYSDGDALHGYVLFKGVGWQKAW